MDEEQAAFQKILSCLRPNSVDRVEHRDRILAEALQLNTSVRKLMLKRAVAHDDAYGPEILAIALRTSRVCDLDLEANSIHTAQAVTYLTTCLKGSLVRRLCLNSNLMGDKGVRALADSLKSLFVTALGLQCTQLTHVGAQALAKALQGFHSHSFGSGEEPSGQCRSNCPGERTMQDHMANALPLSSAAALTLDVCELGDDGVTALAGRQDQMAGVLQASKLMALRLWINAVGDEGVKALAGIPGSPMKDLNLGQEHGA